MKTYVLISRHDTEMGETICSLSQLELYEKMKADYDEAKKELERNSVVSYASCCDTSAMIIAGGDGWEWNIKAMNYHCRFLQVSIWEHNWILRSL